MKKDLVLTVTMLNEYVNGVLANDIRLKGVLISGEISGLKVHSSGHVYFTLKDADSSVRCMMFRSSAAGMSVQPRDGMQVIVRGSASVYPRDGQFRIVVSSLRENGEGELYRRFLQLKSRLEAEGLFENKRALPLLPACIGVATSESGAVLHDIVTVIRRRFPSMRILFAPCAVQGMDAPREICAAIRALDASKKCGVIIVARGGGSYEELSCFNDVAVARAIAACSVPVVSAVGHETDYTIADLAADMRASTPSAAAELCCPISREIEAALDGMVEDMRSRVLVRMQSAREKLNFIRGSAAMASPRHVIDIRKERLAATMRQLDSCIGRVYDNAVKHVEKSSQMLASVSPLAVLKRGYALVTVNGECVTSISQLQCGDEAVIRLTDGAANVSVKSLNKIESTSEVI